MKLVTFLLGAVLMASSLAGCGGDEDSGAGSAEESASSESSPDADEPTDDGGEAAGGDYCGALESAKEQLESLEGEGADLTRFDDVIGALRDVSEQAPSEVSDDWQQLLDGFDTFQQALDDAGVSLEDVADPTAMGELDPEALQELTKQLETLDSKAFEQAGQSISKHAKAECGIELDNG